MKHKWNIWGLIVPVITAGMIVGACLTVNSCQKKNKNKPVTTEEEMTMEDALAAAMTESNSSCLSDGLYGFQMTWDSEKGNFYYDYQSTDFYLTQTVCDGKVLYYVTPQDDFNSVLCYKDGHLGYTEASFFDSDCLFALMAIDTKTSNPTYYLLDNTGESHVMIQHDDTTQEWVLIYKRKSSASEIRTGIPSVNSSCNSSYVVSDQTDRENISSLYVSGTEYLSGMYGGFPCYMLKTTGQSLSLDISFRKDLYDNLAYDSYGYYADEAVDGITIGRPVGCGFITYTINNDEYRFCYTDCLNGSSDTLSLSGFSGIDNGKMIFCTISFYYETYTTFDEQWYEKIGSLFSDGNYTKSEFSRYEECYSFYMVLQTYDQTIINNTILTGNDSESAELLSYNTAGSFDAVSGFFVNNHNESYSVLVNGIAPDESYTEEGLYYVTFTSKLSLPKTYLIYVWNYEEDIISFTGLINSEKITLLEGYASVEAVLDLRLYGVFHNVITDQYIIHDFGEGTLELSEGDYEYMVSTTPLNLENGNGNRLVVKGEFTVITDTPKPKENEQRLKEYCSLNKNLYTVFYEDSYYAFYSYLNALIFAEEAAASMADGYVLNGISYDNAIGFQEALEQYAKELVAVKDLSSLDPEHCYIKDEETSIPEEDDSYPVVVSDSVSQFYFIKDEAGIESNFIVLVDEDGRKLTIDYSKSLQEQLLASDLKKGNILVEESNIYKGLAMYYFVYE